MLGLVVLGSVQFLQYQHKSWENVSETTYFMLIGTLDLRQSMCAFTS